MAIDFPNSPVTNDTHVVGDRKWVYDGEKWALVSASPELLVVSATAPTNTNVIWADTTVAGTIDSFIPSGAMMPFAGATSPTGWLLCYGQTLVRATYPNLFAVVGTTYNTGGEAGTDFRLPDLRGRVPAGLDNMGGSAASRLTSTVLSTNNTLGATGGAQTHTLSSAEMPSHTHTQNSHGHTIVNPSTGNQILYMGAGSSGFDDQWAQGSQGGLNIGTPIQATTATNQNTGGGGAHNNVQPTIILNYIIKT